MSNGIKCLPDSIGFLSLDQLILTDNLLEDLSRDIVLRGVPKTTWACRQTHYRKIHGEVPKGNICRSIMTNECLALEPKFKAKITAKRPAAETNGNKIQLQ